MFRHQVCHIIASKFSGNPSQTGGRSLVGFLSICSDFLCVWYTGQGLPLSSHLCRPPQLFLAACSLIFSAGYILSVLKASMLMLTFGPARVRPPHSIFSSLSRALCSLLLLLNKVLRLRWYLTNGFEGFFGGTC